MPRALAACTGRLAHCAVRQEGMPAPRRRVPPPNRTLACVCVVRRMRARSSVVWSGDVRDVFVQQRRVCAVIAVQLLLGGHGVAQGPRDRQEQQQFGQRDGASFATSG